MKGQRSVGVGGGHARLQLPNSLPTGRCTRGRGYATQL